MASIELDLHARMSATDGAITLSGVQALLRVPVDQYRADAARGLRTATLLSGYRGSPLGGVEGVYQQHKAALDAAEVRFISGVNEDLAATAIWGSQMAALEPDCQYDGVKGIWYGKGPGVDRSGDAMRHAVFAGVAEHGGVLALAGDDPECKSSTIPSASEGVLADIGMPVVYPADVADCLRLGRYGFELSRAAGLWVGVKVHTDVADGFATVAADAGDIDLVEYVHEVDGERWRPTVDSRLINPFSLMLEEELYGERIEAARGFARANAIDRSWGAHDAWLGIVVAGKPLGDVTEALSNLGIATDALGDFGIRIYVPGMISPLEPQGLRSFARGLDTVLVVESKRAFLETQVRDLLYGGPDQPLVLGKHGVDRGPLVASHGVVSSAILDGPLRQVLETRIEAGRLARVRERIPVTIDHDPTMPLRTAYFCSGCPHNRSTVVPDGSVALGGIGCHAMALYMDRSTEGITQMGGEGAQWVGTAPFVGDQHRFQNLGDGTLFHSGSLAIRQAVSAGTNITYKILYNGVVAMTGGQEAAGEMPVPELTSLLMAEGVVRTVVVTDDVGKYARDVTWASNSSVVDRSELDRVQRELREISGVTALVYDQGCAADLRRNRKRGRIEAPTTRIMIDEAICEGCGHCGEISNCMSVHPVETPFGRKTRIHQESCNFDLTCVEGNCPAFVKIEIEPTDSVDVAGPTVTHDRATLPHEPTLPERSTLLVVGIGGTGVVTVSQVLSTAAMLDGRVATSLDQTGLAQKGGQVVSNIHIGPQAYEGAAKVGGAAADTMLIFDMVGGATPAVLERGDPGQTVALVSTSRVPTGHMVSNTAQERFPATAEFRVRIDARTDPDANVWLDAEAITRHVFASQPAANMLMLGLCHQLGRLPVGSAAIERAIAVNGVAVDANVAAFRLGRRIAVEPGLSESMVLEASHESPTPPAPNAATTRLVDSLIEPGAELVDILHWRLPELVAWGDERTAERYIAVIRRVRAAEHRIGGGRTELGEVSARHLFKLMAYKDEYEVARLALRSDIAERARRRFGPNARVSYQLKPPTLKKAGFDRKVSIAESAGRAMFGSLVRTKRLRGTRLDPFGRSEERRIERELVGEYTDLLDELCASLTGSNYEEAVAIADLADVIRGFDDVKLANVAEFRAQVAAGFAARRS